MAEVNTDGGGGHGGKHDKKRAKKQSTKIDMTPMVDLAFLLLTFFVMTSTFAKPKAMEILYPADPDINDPKPPVIKNALTFLVSGNDKVYYYNGEFVQEGVADAEGKPSTVLTKTNYSKDGLRKVLLDRNKNIRDQIVKEEERLKSGAIPDSTFKKNVKELRGSKEAVTVLIKTDDKANFKNVIDIIDDLRIAQIGKMAVIDIMPGELELLNKTIETDK